MDVDSAVKEAVRRVKVAASGVHEAYARRGIGVQVPDAEHEEAMLRYLAEEGIPFGRGQDEPLAFHFHLKRQQPDAPVEFIPVQ